MSHGLPAQGEFVETRGRPKIDQLGEQAIPASRREAGRPRSGHVPEASGREAGQRLTSLVSIVYILVDGSAGRELEAVRAQGRVISCDDVVSCDDGLSSKI